MAAEEEVESLVKSREQRKNAGNKMSKLLADELGDDEFYKTALGGFEEESGDEEYVSEAEESDQIDSDFSISETDEVVEQDVEDDAKKKRKKTIPAKPKRPKVDKKDGSSKSVPKTKEKRAKDTIESHELRESRRKSTRALTMESSDKHRKRMERKQKVEKKQVTFSQIRHLTQKELLAEAKLTEEVNVASLKAYQKMEETKKKTKNLKAVRKEPVIRYLSLSMPLIEATEEKEINVEDDGNENEQKMPNSEKEEGISTLKCSRNFIIFTDPKTFPAHFLSDKKVPLPQKAYCPVTGLPAKYKDPLTGLPYATAQAFRYIREHYAKKTADVEEKSTEGRLRSSQRLAQQTVVES